MRAGCIAQGIVGLGSFETQRGGLSTERLKSGAVNSWGRPIDGAPRFSPHRVLGSARLLTPGFWLLAPSP